MQWLSRSFYLSFHLQRSFELEFAKVCYVLVRMICWASHELIGVMFYFYKISVLDFSALIILLN